MLFVAIRYKKFWPLYVTITASVRYIVCTLQRERDYSYNLCALHGVCACVMFVDDIDCLYTSLHSKRICRCVCSAAYVLCTVRTLPYVYIPLWMLYVLNGLNGSCVTVRVQIPMLNTFMRVENSELLRICNVWLLYYDVATALFCVYCVHFHS